MDHQTIICQLQLLEDSLDDANLAIDDGDADKAKEAVSDAEDHLQMVRAFILEAEAAPAKDKSRKSKSKARPAKPQNTDAILAKVGRQTKRALEQLRKRGIKAH